MAHFERVRAASSVRKQVQSWRSAGERVALVPTMGNLHAGHLTLVELASEMADRVVVSIFVNPTQFGAGDDLDRYPRTPAEDEALLAEQGRTDLLFSPEESDVYPHGTDDVVAVCLPTLAEELCGRSRPGHFKGVASVVLRFLNIVQPDLLVVGRKDYQQMVLLGRMIEDLHLGVQLVAGPTVREADGLAMSSRNQYLSADERRVAPELNAVLNDLAAVLREGEENFDLHRVAALERLERAGFRADYLELRDASDLSSVEPGAAARPRVLLAAARLGAARLIDNVSV